MEGRAPILLFDEPTLPRTGPLGWVEPAVHWLTESTRPEAVTSRRVVNGWYEDFPDPNGRFADRLTSDVDVDHYQALDELYVHYLLRQTHEDVRYEVGEVGPDFRVYEQGTYVGGVEVLSLFQREDWTVDERRHWRLADELNRRIPPTDGYFVDFEIEEAQQEPPPRRVADFVKRELDRLPPHGKLLHGRSDRVTRAELPAATYHRDGIRIRMSFVPMVAGARAKSDPEARIVGTGPMSGGMVNSAERLRKRIAAKAGGRYDLADAPFVVAVGLHDTFCSDDQVLDALYGGEAVIVQTGQLVRRHDALFGADREHQDGRHRRVSGVAVVSGLRTWQPEQTDVAMYDNPFPARPAPDDLIAVSRRYGPAEKTENGARFDWRVGLSPGRTTPPRRVIPE